MVARREARTPLAARLARLVVSKVPRTEPYDTNILALGEFVRQWIRYVHEWPETFSSLSALMAHPAGDCDDMVIALAALLRRIGIPFGSMFFVVGFRRTGAGLVAKHVWLCVQSSATRKWYTLDPSTFRLRMGQDPASHFDATHAFRLGVAS